jgi:hypothetical protein
MTNERFNELLDGPLAHPLSQLCKWSIELTPSALNSGLALSEYR